MKAIELSITLLEKLQAEKAELWESFSPILEKHQHMALQAEKAIAELNDCINSEQVTESRSEIDLFKDKLPQLHAFYLFHSNLYLIERAKPTGTRSAVKRYLLGQLKKIEHYTALNMDFYLYWRSGSRLLDTQFFTREGAASLGTVDTLAPVLNKNVITPHSLMIATMMANEEIKTFIIQSLSNATQDVVATEEMVPLKWIDTKLGLIEFIYGLHAKGCLQNPNKRSETATITQITALVQKMFKVDLGNTSRAWQVILSRKMEVTSWLKKVEQCLIDRRDAFESRHIKGGIR